MAGSKQAQDSAEKGCKQRPPDTEPDGGEKPLHEQVGNHLMRGRINPEQVLRDNRPVPFVVETGFYPIRKIEAGADKQKDQDNIERRNFAF